MGVNKHFTASENISNLKVKVGCKFVCWVLQLILLFILETQIIVLGGTANLLMERNIIVGIIKGNTDTNIKLKSRSTVTLCLQNKNDLSGKVAKEQLTINTI